MWNTDRAPSFAGCFLVRPVHAPILVCLFILNTIGSARAQWCTPDEREALQLHYVTLSQDSDRYSALLGLASMWTLSGKAAPYLRQADSLYQRMVRDERPEVRRAATGGRGFQHYLMGYQAKFHRDMPVALAHFREALAFHADPKAERWIVVQDQDAIGVVYRSAGLLLQAKTAFQEELRMIAARGGRDIRISTQAHLHMAQVLADLGEWDGAMHELALCDTIDIADRASVLMERARVRELRGDRTGALTLYNAAAATIARAPNAWDRISVLLPKARFHLAANEVHEGLATAEECVAIAEERGDEAAWCGCMLLAGEARQRMGDVHGMERDLRSVLDTAAAYGYMGLAREAGDEGSMVHAAGMLKDFYRAEGRTKEALGMTTLWAALRDTLHFMQGQEELLRYDLQLETVKDSLATIRRIEQATAHYQQELVTARRDRELMTLGGALGGLLLLIGALWFFDRRQRTARYEREQAVLHERLRIADDLHDDMGAGLSSLKLRSALAMERASLPEQQEALTALAQSADGLMDNMRQILWAMGTEHSKLGDLVRYIIVYARQQLDERGIALGTVVQGDLPTIELNAMERRNVFLVVKEALHNVVKHAQASKVTLAFRWADGLWMTLSDDGQGLSAEPVTKGNGMRTMRKRAQALGGEVLISAGPVAGTVVSLFVPLKSTMNKRPIAAPVPPEELRADG